MDAGKNTAWVRHLDVIADELARLTAICDVKLREPRVIERILKGDDAVCGKRNPIAFRKLRSLLAATYSSMNKAIDRLGADELKVITDAVIERIDRHRQAGGQPSKKPR